MKTIKTPEEILVNHIDKQSMDELSENVWPDMIDAMVEYHAQFTSTSEEVEKAKEKYIKSYNSGTAVIFGQKIGVYEDPEKFIPDLNALIELVQNEKKDDSKTEDIKGRALADLIEGKTVTIKDVEYVTATRAKELMLKFAMCCVQKMTPKMPTEEMRLNILIILSQMISEYSKKKDWERRSFADWLYSYAVKIVKTYNQISHLQEPEAPVYGTEYGNSDGNYKLKEAPEIDQKIIDGLSGEPIIDTPTITSTTYPPKGEKEECPLAEIGKCLKGCMDDTCIYHPNNR